MNNFFNRNFMNKSMINSSWASCNNWFFENRFVSNSLNRRWNNSNLSSDSIKNWLDNFLSYNLSSRNINCSCVDSVSYNSWHCLWLVVDYSIRWSINLYLNIFSCYNWLNNCFSMNLSTWNCDILCLCWSSDLSCFSSCWVSHNLWLSLINLYKFFLN